MESDEGVVEGGECLLLWEGGVKWGHGGREEGHTVDELGVVEVESGAETNRRVMNKRSLRSLMLWSNH